MRTLIRYAEAVGMSLDIRLVAKQRMSIRRNMEYITVGLLIAIGLEQSVEAIEYLKLDSFVVSLGALVML